MVRRKVRKVPGCVASCGIMRPTKLVLPRTTSRRPPTRRHGQLSEEQAKQRVKPNDEHSNRSNNRQGSTKIDPTLPSPHRRSEGGQAPSPPRPRRCHRPTFRHLDAQQQQ